VDKHRAPRRAGQGEHGILADALGDRPETVISVHLLSHGLCDANVEGDPAHFRGLIVQSHQDPGEPTGFGDDARALWELLKMARGWWCVNTSKACAPRLGTIVEQTGRSVGYYGDVYHTLARPVLPFEHEAVRALELAGLAMLDAAVAEIRGGVAWASDERMLEEGVVAGAVSEGRLFAIAYTSALGPKHADVAVSTLKEWRGYGLATAAASLVVGKVQEQERVPVWSCGEDNHASLGVAHKLGFVEALRRVYVIPQARPDEYRTSENKLSTHLCA
jgi:RimJ/RimL family protein N-acetyltransferase